MEISERGLGATLASAEVGAREVGWFAVRQPGIVRFLEERLLAPDGDAFAVGLEAAWRIWAVFQARDGVPPARIEHSLLERAEQAVIAETRVWALADGCALRQPGLCRWLAHLTDDPPLPLTAGEAGQVGTSLAAVIYALDEVTTGRAVP